VACTVWSNLATTGRLTASETLLVHGGSGGIGTHAIQVGAALGARVIATAGHADRMQLCRDLGADEVIDYHDDLVAEVRRVTDDRGVDVTLDHIGASNLEANLKALATGGRLVIIGLMGGAKAEVNLGAMLTRRLSVAATNLRGRPTEGPDGKGAIVAAVRSQLWPLIEQGRIRPIVHERIPVAEAARAHAAMEGGGVVGKLLLVVRDDG
jgi:NADPH:quinone reductase-like Zn-dependent oxidoreductase